MHYKGIVFFDYDGTLTDEKEEIYSPTKKTLEGINKLNQNGYLTILSTGRSMSNIPDEAKIFKGYITSNGSYAQIADKKIFEDFINRRLLKELIDTLDEMGLCYSLEAQDFSYAKDLSNEKFISMLNNFKLPFDKYLSLDVNNFPDASKVLVAYNNIDEHYKLKEKIKENFSCQLHRKFPSADIQLSTSNKGVGAKKLADALNIKREDMYVFGDGENDYEIFKVCKNSIAMGTHSDVLNEVSSYVTDTVKNEGIYKGLLHYRLISD